MGMRKVNTHGLELAHNGMPVAAAAYNLQKLLYFTPKRSQTAVMVLPRSEQANFFCFCFWSNQEAAMEKETGIRRYTNVVQQAHSLDYTPVIGEQDVIAHIILAYLVLFH
uniref:hypothetical protein n=1 Tax=Pontibacter ummariensis TaxID=1610492 RepID=UPI00359021F9